MITLRLVENCEFGCLKIWQKYKTIDPVDKYYNTRLTSLASDQIRCYVLDSMSGDTS